MNIISDDIVKSQSNQQQFLPNKKFVIEVKPKAQCKEPVRNPKRRTKRWLNEVFTYAVNQAKWKFAREFCENRDMEFKILTEEHLKPKYK